MLGEFDNGMVLKNAPDFQRVAQSKCVPLDNP